MRAGVLPEDEGHAAVEGFFFVQALRLRHHDDSVHAQRMPARKEAKDAYDALEQVRVEVIGAEFMHGVNANLLRKWISQCEIGVGKIGRRKRGEALAAALLPIHLSEPPLAVTVMKPVSVKSPPRLQSSIEIEYAGARVLLHGEVNAQQLEVVLTCISRVA